MDELWNRIVVDLAGRLDGPLWLRVLMQPSIACLLAIRDRRTDWRGVGKVFCVAAVLDIAYQWIVFRFVYPGEVLLVASILALLPYVVVRGLANRLSRQPPGPVG